MRVARRSGVRASMRSSTAPELVASSSAPKSSRSDREMTQSPSGVPSKVTTRVTCGICDRTSRSLLTWVSSSAKTMRLPELDRM